MDKVQSDFFCILRLSFASNASMNLDMSKGIMLTANQEYMELKLGELLQSENKAGTMTPQVTATCKTDF